MQAAITASERGHNVLLCERSDALGGVVKKSDYADFKEQLQRYVQYMIRTVNARGIEVRMNTEVTPELVAMDI